MLYFLCTFAALASPEWSEREAASASLLHLIDRHPAIYGPRLAEWAKDSTEPEIRARVRIPLARAVRARAASYVPKGVPCWPCQDMWPSDLRIPFAPWAAFPCREAKLIRPDPQPFGAPWWRPWRKGTEDMARRMILNGDDEADVDLLLQRMWCVEVLQRADCPTAFEIETWKTWRAGGYPSPGSEP